MDRAAADPALCSSMRAIDARAPIGNAMGLRARSAFVVVTRLAGGGDRRAGIRPENTLYLDLAFGRVVIQMRPDLAPEDLRRRSRSWPARVFITALVFHRVIDGFMAQTGDPNGTGTGGSGHPLKAEFSQKRRSCAARSAMARTSDPNSADSQFFIMLGAAPALDGKYTIWGQVDIGHGVCRQASRRATRPQNGKVTDPDKIVKMQVAADASPTRKALRQTAGKPDVQATK